jgi:hypothetical protein
MSAKHDLSDDRRNAMQKLITATALLILLGGSVAVAQNNARTRDSAGSGSSPQASPNPSGGPIEAPVGHRQPRASDVPSEDSSLKLDAEDAALDRKVKSICRGC